MKTAIVILSLVSAITFVSIMIRPAADPNYAPKAWAHGVGFVLPRALGTLLFAGTALILTGIEIQRRSLRRAVLHPAVFISLVLMLPAVYTLLFLIWIIIASAK